MCQISGQPDGHHMVVAPNDLELPWCINTGKSLIPLTLLFLLAQKRNLLIPLELTLLFFAQKRNLLIPLELSRVMHQGRPRGAGPDCVRCHTRYASALVPLPHRSQVRWQQEPEPRPTSDGEGHP